MKNTFKSLKLKFYAFFVLFMLALIAVVVIYSIQTQQSIVSVSVSLAGRPILERALSYIDGDKYERLVKSLDPNDPFYIETSARFREMKEEMQVQFIYSMAIDENGSHIFIFDAEDPESEYFSPLGEVEEIDDYDITFLQTYETGTLRYTRIMNEYTEWGRLVSAYAPIFNSSGDVVGIVGVDFDGDEIHQSIMGGIWRLIAIAVCLAVIGICMFFFLMRTLSRQNEKLEKALSESNAASIAKSNFLSSMSHEMRTPMNAIIGMTTIGKKASEIEDKNAALCKVEEASSHLLGVINDILDMSKIEAGKMELVPVEFNLEQMIQKVLLVIHSRLDEKKQNLVFNFDNEIPENVIGDDQRLAQVLTNLLYNAVKFTPEEGKILLNISLSGILDDICELHFEVEDNGIGISPENQEKLFDAFEQAEDVTTRIYGGTGLGLSISKRIVEMMNGHIWVESELGKGAKFIFTVRLELCTQPENSLSSSSSANAESVAAAIRGGALYGKRLLIAEDVEINREIVISLLEETGLMIDSAENGKDAYDMVAAKPETYDIIFMDLQMPIMGGLESSRLIRELPERNRGRIPIVALTANVFKEDIDACFEAGMDDHLGKPLDIDKVFEKLVKFLGK